MCVSACAGAAQGAPVFFSELGGGSILQPRNNRRIEARYRADTTNWDTRLEFDSLPEVGDVTGAVSNSKAFFENDEFGFKLNYDHALQQVTWTITGPSPAVGVLNSLTQPTDTMGQMNTLHLFTVGTRGSVTLTDVAFMGLGMDVNAFPDLNTAPAPAVTFKETYLIFGNDFNLLSGDWMLTGKIAFGTFTNNNPSEGAKITVKLRNAEIPAPTALGVFAAAALFGARRRRR
ncbi:MAG TPA: hypothetical protein DEB06_07415 [Phycisphaerales bacterium]|nr:hypothetical protein [Phycisphaerales bacterium]